MTLEEAQGVAAIVAEADGGCSSCVGELVELLNAAFPAFLWAMRNKNDEGEWVGPHVLVVPRP